MKNKIKFVTGLLFIIILVIGISGCVPLESGKEPDFHYCEKDSDCKLVIWTGECRYCPSCRNFKIEDEEVIAVNREWDSGCPPMPEDLVCIACVDSIGFDPEKDVTCINNRCQKCVGEGGSINTMPGPSGEILGPRCCEGLTQIAMWILESPEKYILQTDGAFCTKCGDGVCKEPENIKNCPEDCQEEPQLTTEEYDEDISDVIYSEGDFIAVNTVFTTPTPCYGITPSVSHLNNRIEFLFDIRSTLGPEGACVQVIDEKGIKVKYGPLPKETYNVSIRGSYPGTGWSEVILGPEEIIIE